MNKDQISAKVYEILKKTEMLYNRNWDDVNFNINWCKGKAAGRCGTHWPGGKLKKCNLFFNLAIAAENGKFEETITHEIAHFVAYKMYGRNIKPHGLEWKSVMNDLGYSGDVYHNYVNPEYINGRKYGQKLGKSYWLPKEVSWEEARDKGWTLFWDGGECEVCGIKSPKYVRDLVCKECYSRKRLAAKQARC